MGRRPTKHWRREDFALPFAIPQKDSCTRTTLTVRVVFVHRDGFRQRRLVTSLLNPILFSASDLARLYRVRWDIETFYLDFKQTLSASSWHCQTPRSFHREIPAHMIALCLIRISMYEGSRLKNLYVARRYTDSVLSVLMPGRFYQVG
jgi:IS4 transposase